VVVGALRWGDGPGGGVRGRRIGRVGGWTAFAGPALATCCKPIVDVILMSAWPACARTSWPLIVAVAGLEFSLILFRIFVGGTCLSQCGWPALAGSD